ncbi:MAG: hypothetical protein NTW86_06010 [Candidatus Sumerlaeota bacterium]|nr:hypothetical protein [Candidatus Sumerlaeota bacterium]
MALADDIERIKNHALLALDGSHDYYTHTKRIWRLLQEDIRDGRRVEFRNRTTGTRADGQSLLALAQRYLTVYLIPSSFQHFVSLFEDFFFDLLRVWLVAHAESLSKKQVEFGSVLRASDKAAIVSMVVDRDLHDLGFKRVDEWFAYLERLVKLGCPAAEEIENLAEIKASRDILVHNNGIANAKYVEKAGRLARYSDGQRLEIPEPYHRASWETIRRVVQEVSEAAIRKV